MTHRPSLTDAAHWDPCTKWVRVVGQRANGMVEFEFAVGEPQLYVEMVMPRAEFESFCALHGVTPTQGPLADAPAGSAEHEWDWNRAAHARSTSAANPEAFDPKETRTPCRSTFAPSASRRCGKPTTTSPHA